MERLLSWLEGIVVALIKALTLGGWTEEDMKRLMARQGEVLDYLRSHFFSKEELGNSTLHQLSRWVRIYREKFGITLDISKIPIPKRRRGFDRLVVVAVDNLDQIFSVCRGLFGLLLYRDDLTRAVTSIRTCANGPYAIWVRDRKEADEENRDRSAESFNQVDGVTFQERLLFGVIYFLETGEHLDSEKWTLCAGSRAAGGGVPGVGWGPGSQTVDVDWCGAQFHDPGIAVRSAVAASA